MIVVVETRRLVVSNVEPFARLYRCSFNNRTPRDGCLPAGRTLRPSDPATGRAGFALPSVSTTLLAMPQYAAILGHQPQISIAELSAIAPGFAPIGTMEKFILLFESSADLSQDALNHLGGIIVMARQIQSSSGLTMEDLPKILSH